LSLFCDYLSVDFDRRAFCQILPLIPQGLLCYVKPLLNFAKDYAKLSKEYGVSVNLTNIENIANKVGPGNTVSSECEP
jgi:hypothetical protein